MNDHNTDINRTNADARLWEMVEQHAGTIEVLVNSAVSRGRIPASLRDDAVTEATLLAFELAGRHDGSKAPFEHYLKYSVSRYLRGISNTSDALDHSTDNETAATNVRADREWTVLPSGWGGHRPGAGRPKDINRCTCGKHTERQAILQRLKCRKVGPSAPPITSL